MAFTNTVETVGDAALTRSIIDRSITKLNCNITTSIRQQAFRACSALASVNFPNCITVSDNAFYGCSALAKAEFGSAVAFANNAFYGCSNLTALILRSTDQLCTITGTPFASSAIASGTGYIYVPAALVDQYKASWTAYAGQIRAIEDYPGIDDPYSWAGVAANIADGSYKSVYNVGDLVPLNMGSEGLVNMQIAAFDADDLSDGSGKAAISWISKELLKTAHRMNPALVTNDDGTYQEGTGTVGGWEKSELRAYMIDTILPLIPSDVQSMIKTVAKASVSMDANGGTDTKAITQDAIWIPSSKEVKNAFEQHGRYYSGLFSDNGSRKKYIVNTSSIASWWLRSAYLNQYKSYCEVRNTGTMEPDHAEKLKYIPLGFCT